MKDLEEQRVCVKLFQRGKKPLRRLFRCCNRLMERTVWALHNVASGTSVSNGTERPLKTTPNLDGLPRQWTTIMLTKCPLWFVKIVAQLSMKLPKKYESVKVRATWLWPKNGRCVVLPKNSCHVCWHATPYPRIFDEAWEDCCPPAALLSRFGPCRLFHVPEVEILTKRSPISDSRGDRRKFDMGPSCCPAKHIPGCVLEMEKNVGSDVSRVEGSTSKVTRLIKL